MSLTNVAIICSLVLCISLGSAGCRGAQCNLCLCQEVALVCARRPRRLPDTDTAHSPPHPCTTQTAIWQCWIFDGVLVRPGRAATYTFLTLLDKNLSVQLIFMPSENQRQAHQVIDPPAPRVPALPRGHRSHWPPWPCYNVHRIASRCCDRVVRRA